jgi:hypothetical protein
MNIPLVPAGVLNGEVSKERGQPFKHLGTVREGIRRHSSHTREFLTRESTLSLLFEGHAEPESLG